MTDIMVYGSIIVEIYDNGSYTELEQLKENLKEYISSYQNTIYFNIKNIVYGTRNGHLFECQGYFKSNVSKISPPETEAYVKQAKQVMEKELQQLQQYLKERHEITTLIKLGYFPNLIPIPYLKRKYWGETN